MWAWFACELKCWACVHDLNLKLDGLLFATLSMLCSCSFKLFYAYPFVFQCVTICVEIKRPFYYVNLSIYCSLIFFFFCETYFSLSSACLLWNCIEGCLVSVVDCLVYLISMHASKYLLTTVGICRCLEINGVILYFGLRRDHLKVGGCGFCFTETACNEYYQNRKLCAIYVGCKLCLLSIYTLIFQTNISPFYSITVFANCTTSIVFIKI